MIRRARPPHRAPLASWAALAALLWMQGAPAPAALGAALAGAGLAAMLRAMARPPLP